MFNKSPRRNLVALCLGVTAALVPVSPALAHDRLVSTTPSAGAALERTPATLKLTFSEKVLPVGTQVVVKDASGTNLATASSVSGSVVTTRLSPGRAGSHQVAWRVVSQDGHPITGLFRFTTRQGTSTASPSPTAATTSAPTASPSPSATPSTEHGGGARKIMLFLLPIVSMGGILFMATRNRRTRTDKDPTS